MYYKEAIRRKTKEAVERRLGITYEEFEDLDFDKQQLLIEQNRRRKRNDSIDEYVRVMVGSGRNAFFISRRRGERYYLSDGTPTIIGDTPEDARDRLNQRMDEIAYEKGHARVKRMLRRFGDEFGKNRDE